MADSQEACCTCASLLNTASTTSLLTEKPVIPQPPRRLPCCSRAICSSCLSSNPRFQIYCPFCQVSTEPTSLPQGLRDPPEYSSAPSSPQRRAADLKQQASTTVDDAEDQLPPPYASKDNRNGAQQRQKGPDEPPEEDVVHHLHPSDSIASISLAYRVPAPVLRSHNSLFSDSLLPARRTLLIPRSHYSGESLAPTPVESEEESERKSAIRKFMVGAKVHEYEVAELYLAQAGGDVDRALERWKEDERWEKENPYEARNKGKGKDAGRSRRTGAGGGLTGQLR